jgi:hypothetical protein
VLDIVTVFFNFSGISIFFEVKTIILVSLYCHLSKVMTCSKVFLPMIIRSIDSKKLLNPKSSPGVTFMLAASNQPISPSSLAMNPSRLVPIKAETFTIDTFEK